MSLGEAWMLGFSLMFCGIWGTVAVFLAVLDRS